MVAIERERLELIKRGALVPGSSTELIIRKCDACSIRRLATVWFQVGQDN